MWLFYLSIATVWADIIDYKNFRQLKLFVDQKGLNDARTIVNKYETTRIWEFISHKNEVLLDKILQNFYYKIQLMLSVGPEDYKALSESLGYKLQILYYFIHNFINERRNSESYYK